MERAALYPGTFDPFTVGHLSIVERGLRLFDRVVVAVGINGEKHAATDVEARLAAIRSAVGHLSGVEVLAFTGLAVDAAAECGCGFMLRGVRSVADFDYERNMAQANRDLSGIESVLLYALSELGHVSSTLVRDLQRHGRDASAYLP
ncbi:MAG: pantetheine-phosphate adenylyltransferase [Muribaculaceae bacterium]|nr:pantetheine-phosphate adenylyltransferase [Muribaculaceae bacterium]